MNAIPYVHTSKRLTLQDPPTEIVTVRIDPQTHEMRVPASTAYETAMKEGIRPEDALIRTMVDLIRGQALTAYETVMRGGLTALAGRNMEASEVESSMQHYVEVAARELETAQAEAKRWQDLAVRRGVEVEALERAIARRVQ